MENIQSQNTHELLDPEPCTEEEKKRKATGRLSFSVIKDDIIFHGRLGWTYPTYRADGLQMSITTRLLLLLGDLREKTPCFSHVCFLNYLKKSY